MAHARETRPSQHCTPGWAGDSSEERQGVYQNVTSPPKKTGSWKPGPRVHGQKEILLTLLEETNRAEQLWLFRTSTWGAQGNESSSLAGTVKAMHREGGTWSSSFFKNWNWFHVVVEYESSKLRTFLGSYNSFIKESVCMVEWNCRLNWKDSFWFVTNFLTSYATRKVLSNPIFLSRFFKNKTPWWGRWK